MNRRFRKLLLPLVDCAYDENFDFLAAAPFGHRHPCCPTTEYQGDLAWLSNRRKPYRTQGLEFG